MITARIAIPALALCFFTTAISAGDIGWKLVWEDDFKKDDFIDPAKWVKIGRGTSDWNLTPSRIYADLTPPLGNLAMNHQAPRRTPRS